MDRAAVALVAVVPRGWMLVGLCGLAPAFVAAQAGDAAALAVGLGGLLLGFKAFHRLTAGVWSLAGAAIAWQQTSPVFAAAGTLPIASTPAAPTAPSGPASVVLEATDLRFTHPGRQQPVLRGCTLSLTAGDRVILQGPSGGGKSTLASILAGLRSPQAGLLLADGLDYQTLGLDGWRRRIVLVPQFHENHLALGSLAFNLLMGTEWPAGEEEFSRAEGVLRELGLGPTLDRMPSGLLQTVGETGWQLSHGERSRIYLARALLQGAEVVLLDESLSSLDSENLMRCFRVAAKRSPALVVVTHE
jgi:ATP-binding cassette subfamily B protein